MANGWEYGADPRHAELIIEQLGVSESRTLSTPGVDGEAEEDSIEDIAISGADGTRFRGVAARCNYLAMDRPDIQFATNEVCREMSSPTIGSYRRLKIILFNRPVPPEETENGLEIRHAGGVPGD